MVKALVACGKCEACLANVRYRCSTIVNAIARDNGTNGPTVEVECARCGERFQMLDYLAAFAKDYHAVVWCDDCRAGGDKKDEDVHWSDR